MEKKTAVKFIRVEGGKVYATGMEKPSESTVRYTTSYRDDMEKFNQSFAEVSNPESIQAELIMNGALPEERQKEIIQNCLLTDKEYQNINVRTVSKWLEINGKQYFQQEAHQKSEEDPDWKPLEGEARDKMIQEYLKAIASTTQAFTSAMDEGHKGSGTRLRDNIEQATGIKRYVIDGIEIYAISEDEALAQRNQIV